MRLSMIDHEDHQKKFNDQAKANSASGNATPNTVANSSSVGPSSARGSFTGTRPEQKESTKSRFLSSIKRDKNRSRSGSNASNKSVSFSPMPISGPGPSRNSGSSSPTSTSPNIQTKHSNLNPSSASPVPATSSLVDHTSADDFGPSTSTPANQVNSGALPEIPRISFDMAPITPDRVGPTSAKSSLPHQFEHDEGEQEERPTYARLDSEA